jgi:hypothetical protein
MPTPTAVENPKIARRFSPRVPRGVRSILPIAAAMGISSAGGVTAATPNDSILPELSIQDKSLLDSGKNVVITVEKPNATWPEVRIYRKVNATPETIVNLFLDYEHANTFIPDLQYARVENTPDSNTKDVRYKIRLPVIFSVNYLVRNTYEKTETGYKIKWLLLEPPFAAKSAVGSLRVEPWATTTTSSIICYANHVEPATRIIAGLRGHAIKEAEKTVNAIADEATRRSTSPLAPVPVQL